MKKLSTLIALAILCLAMLASCSGKNGDIPEGLQLVKESAADGYVMYGPEGWTVSNRAGISACYVSPVNNTSISLAVTDIPEGDLGEYFIRSFDALPYTPTVVKNGERCNFGNAKEAYKFVYTYTVGEYRLACMQVLIKNSDRLYIFTYSSYGDIEDETSDYRTYLEQVQLAMDNFKLTTPDGTPESGSDSTEMVLVTDKRVTGYELYLPACYELIDNSALTSARISDLASITVSKATGTGVSIGQYWENRREQLSAYVTDITEISVNNTNTDGDGVAVVFGDLDPAKVASYEYTYMFDGTLYHVYQVMGVDSWNGYVFTYTATEDEYALHLDQISAILSAVRFK